MYTAFPTTRAHQVSRAGVGLGNWWDEQLWIPMQESWDTTTKEWWLLTGQGAPPTINPTGPAYTPPLAPQTGWGMVNWSPEMMSESVKAAYQQNQRDASNAPRLSTEVGTVDPTPVKSFVTTGLLMVGGVLLFAFLSKR